jgi:hypothetical protein
MTTLNEAELSAVHVAIDKFGTILSMYDISLDIQHDFSSYVAIRHDHGDLHLNQAFDPAYASIGKQDFWLRARNRRGEVIATYCVRWFNIDNFYRLIRSQALWFSAGPGPIGRALAFECDIPPFGGEITHGGGLWVRPDWRGSSRLAYVLPRVARALSLSERPFDHDTGMIRNDPRDSLKAAERKAAFASLRVYGFARVSQFVNGWFPPEGRNAIMHLCHATKTEAIASLSTVAVTTRIDGADCGHSSPILRSSTNSLQPHNRDTGVLQWPARPEGMNNAALTCGAQPSL